MNILQKSQQRSAKRINEWEEARNVNFETIAFKMLDAAAGFFAEPANRIHFSREIVGKEKINKFLNDVHMAMKSSLIEYIYHDLGYEEIERRSSLESWKNTEKTIRKINDLLLKIPKKNEEIISKELKKNGFPTLNGQVRSSIRRALYKSISQKGLFDPRGTKRSGVAVLSCALFENLEWRLGRDLARSFEIRPTRRYMDQHPEQKLSRDFVNHDAKLIYHLVKVVIPSAAIETVQSALKNMPSKASYN